MATISMNLFCGRILISKSLTNTRLYLKNILVSQQSSKNIMTTAVRSKKLLETLKENPYFDKYAGAITRLQETNPDEFVSRVEATEKKTKKKPSIEKGFKSTPCAKPNVNKNPPNTPSAQLSQVMKLDLLENQGKDEIANIWLNYHKNKDCICSFMEPKTYDIMFERAMKFPTFILPLPRTNGYEFILSQFSGNEIHMTPLLWYQTHQENAPECLTIVHYTDLRESKDLILMKGEFDTKCLNVQEAQCLANELKLYYSTDDHERLNLLKTFHENPDKFKHMDVISQLESITFSSGNNAKIISYKFFNPKTWWSFSSTCQQSASATTCKRFTRHYSDYRSKRVYITTPIFYVNAGPHIGHLYTAALADSMVRFNQMLGHEVFFNTGTDEHGMKVKNAATLNNLSPLEYCDQVSGLFKEMCQNFDINYTRFIRTTASHHKDSVHQFWTTLQDSGNIYMGKYSGWYCVSDEAFVPETELEEIKDTAGNPIKVSRTSGHPVEWMEEENYKFRLSSFQNDLKYWLKDESVVQPAKFHQMLLSWIEDGQCLEDLSISRPTSRVPWGITVPQHESHTVYVWLDALVNYLSSLGYPSNKKFSQFWPPSIQIVGKDILKFHGVYWPAFLMAAGMDPPRCILCHSHWLVRGEKMSKSKNNVVSPQQAAKTFTTDGLRYFLLREAVPHSDANYSEDQVRKVLNAELADTLGNLVSRCMGKAINPQGFVPTPLPTHSDVLNTEETTKLVESLQSLANQAEMSYNKFNLHLVVDSVMQTLFAANKMIEHHKPWHLAKQPSENIEAKIELNAVLALGLEAARISALVLYPLTPRLSSNLLDSLNVPSNARMWNNCMYLNTGRQSTDQSKTESKIFFKRLQ